MASDCVQSCDASKRGTNFSNRSASLLLLSLSFLFNAMKYLHLSPSLPMSAPGIFPSVLALACQYLKKGAASSFFGCGLPAAALP